jgi:hypothetical protein
MRTARQIAKEASEFSIDQGSNGFLSIDFFPSGKTENPLFFRVVLHPNRNPVFDRVYMTETGWTRPDNLDGIKIFENYDSARNAAWAVYFNTTKTPTL